MNEYFMRVDRALQRFSSRVHFNGDCWEWTGFKDQDGYGKFESASEQRAPRVAWILFNGIIPAGAWVLHSCDNPPCVNPDHLFLGSPRDNTQDASHKGRLRGQNLIECCHGHPFDEINTYLTPQGGRRCKTCRRLAMAKYNHKERL